jgi:blocked-early-in-transport protein 1
MYNKPSDRYAADRTADDIQGQNDEALEGLSQKVKLLKNVSLSLSLSLREDMALGRTEP